MESGAIPLPPLWTVAPFALYLLAIALVPLIAPHFWEPNRNKLGVAAVASIPVVAYLLASAHGAHWLAQSLKEYVAFIALLGALYAISGGIHLKGSLAGTPLSNTVFLALGAVLASVIGTTGASMLLIRPILRANRKRDSRVHIVVFFIFIVANGGGLLTPLGDPPLFLGFLRGVPFFWTLRLAGAWAMVNGLLLLIFNLLDQYALNNEERRRSGSQLEAVQEVKVPLVIEGGINFLWLMGVVATILAVGTWGDRLSPNEDVHKLVHVTGMLLMTALSFATTANAVRKSNHYTWHPMAEVAVIFIGIFVTMAPALKVLEMRGGELGLTRPWQFFWATGTLSSFLDNAPTYLTFASLAVGASNRLVPGQHLSAADLSGLISHPAGAMLLAAISAGAVFMGANTYIGNGPNFMVKAIAESQHVKMPSFFGYMLWSLAVLVPIFVLVTLVFFRA